MSGKDRWGADGFVSECAGVTCECGCADVAQALVHIQSKVSLKFTPIEDATIGFWVMGMDLRQIDHPKYAPLTEKTPFTLRASHLWGKRKEEGALHLLSILRV